ncbi:hypothetical protein [Actinomadura rupiterrae]|uniref:hypothetical protein n=1 Tax=Actinomadura rupiterrae TaxID=559627 RepID=UPI0020A337D9|nr:hypothetical protein [Actinomadura rupiterrae]MCP2336223.1 hypothetical protein [Actinomadura rupiterrae]
MNELDELNELKNLRAAPPEMSTQTRHEIRARLLALSETPGDAPGVLDVAGRRSGGRGTAGWRRSLLPVAAAVVLTLGIGVGAAALRGGSDGGHVQSPAYRSPRPHQWLYVHRINAGGWNMNYWWKGVDSKTTEQLDTWDRVDGLSHAYINSKGALSVMPPPDGRTVRVQVPAGGKAFNLTNYDKLPAEPDALLREFYAVHYPNQVGRTGPRDVFEDLTEMLQKPISPRLRSAAYQALFKIPGVAVRPGLADQIGRRGDGFSWDDGGDRETFIFDPESHRFLGGGEDATRDFSRGSVHVKKGTLLMWYSVTEYKIVDRPGQR